MYKKNKKGGEKMTAAELLRAMADAKPFTARRDNSDTHAVQCKPGPGNPPTPCGRPPCTCAKPCRPCRCSLGEDPTL